MIRLATIGSALLLGAPLVVATSCIVKEDCVYTPKVGHPWRVTITAQVKRNGQPDTEEGVAEACYSDAENAAL